MSESDRKLKILVLASTYPRWEGDHEPGFVHELSKRLARDAEVVVLCPHAAGALVRELSEGVDVVRYRYAPSHMETLVHGGGIIANLRRAKWKALLLPGFVLSQLWGAWRLTRRHKFDVIHAHWLIPQGLIAALLQFVPGPAIPFVVTSHGGDLFALRDRLWVLVKRFVLARAAAVTVVSSAMQSEILSWANRCRQIEVLSMGVDVSHRFQPDARAVRNPDEILFVGRLVEKKGVQYLLRAMPRILRERPTAFLTIAGFGPEESQLRELVRALDLTKSVHFIGAVPQSDLPAYYRRAAVFVAPFVRADSGDQDGLPVALMEAIACGCPVIAGDVPGLRDLLGDQARSVAVDPKSEPQMAKAVLGVLDSPASVAARAVEMSAYVRENFDWAKISAGYADVLFKAAASGEP